MSSPSEEVPLATAADEDLGEFVGLRKNVQLGYYVIFIIFLIIVVTIGWVTGSMFIPLALVFIGAGVLGYNLGMFTPRPKA
jgi:hypothetical protein